VQHLFAQVRDFIHFSVEAFTPVEGFNPAKPYRSRLLWRDQDGQTQSKLLLAEPEAVLAMAVRGEAQAAPAPGVTGKPARRTSRRRTTPAPA